MQLGILGIINELNTNEDSNYITNIPSIEENLLSSLFEQKVTFNIPKNNNIIVPGIYILSKPIMINNIECLIITLEGIDKYSENLIFAHQLRNIILIFSTLIIYHGTDNLEIIKQNINNMLKYIKNIKSSNLKTELTKEYMCDLLCEINVQAEDENVNSSINKFSSKISNKKFFKSFELINKYNKAQKSLNYKLKWIKENFEIKRLNNTELNGNLICDLMENLCEKFNIEDTPILNDLLENILLSKMNEISEVIETQFKTKFNKYIDENNSQNLNFYDLISFYISFHNEEGIPNLCKSTIASMINLKSAESYLKKILSTTYGNINMMFTKSKNKYEDLISKFGNSIHHKNEPKNFGEMKEYLNNLVKYLKKYFIPIISYKMFNFDSNLCNKVNKYIINKLNFIVENLSQFEQNEKKNTQKKIEDYIKALEEKDSQGIILEQSIRDLKNKEREYLNRLEIEKKRYETFEKYFQAFQNENQKKLSDSQNKVNELIKENYNLKNKKLITDEDFSLNGIKSDYSFVKNKLNEYKNLIVNYNNQMNLNLEQNIFEKEVKLLNDNFEKIINNKFNDLNEFKEKATKYKSEFDKVNFEMTQLKIELEDEQQKFNLLKKQLENEQKKYDSLLVLFNEQKSLLYIQEEKIKLQNLKN